MKDASNPYQPPKEDGRPGARSKNGVGSFVFKVIAIIVNVVTVLGIVVALLLSAFLLIAGWAGR